MTLKKILAVSLMAFGLSGPAMAATLDVTSITGVWTNSTQSIQGLGTDQIRWGRSYRGGGLSGYDFDAASAQTVREDTSFTLGTFTHRNIPILGSLQLGVELAVSFTIKGVAAPIKTVFNFDHYETYNRSSTCANGDRNRVGVNSNGCADRVTASKNEAKSESFVVGNTEYVMDISGFLFGDDLLTEFWTVENKNNSSILQASFRAIGTTQEPPSEVPLPASGFLLLGGIAGLAFARKRR